MSSRAMRPVLFVHERGGRVVKLEVHHRGSVPSLLDRFPLAVVRRAAARFDLWRTRREEGIARLARRLDTVSREIVYQHLLLPHCERMHAQQQRTLARQRRVRVRRLEKQARVREEGHRPPTPTLTERLAREESMLPAQPRSAPDLSRGR